MAGPSLRADPPGPLAAGPIRAGFRRRSGRPAAWRCRNSRTQAAGCASSARIPTAHPLRTPSGKVEIFSQTIAGFDEPDCPGHPTWLPRSEPARRLRAAPSGRQPAHHPPAQPARFRRPQRRGQAPRPRGGAHASRRRGGARHRRRRHRPPVQRSRRLPRRRAPHRRHPPRRRAAADRRLVRPGRSRRTKRRSACTATRTSSPATSAPPASPRAAPAS